MALSVTLKSGTKDVMLPNGKRYKAGDIAVMSDDEITLLSKTAIANLFTAAPVLITSTWTAGGV